MINRLIYYLLTFVAVFAAACSNIDEMESPVPDQNLVMRFDMGCDTKVSTADITSQEFIVYDYIYGASSEGYQDGTCYIDGSKVTLKYRNGRWDFYSNNGDTRVDFLWTKTGEHRFYAFNKVEYQVSMAKYQNTFVFNDGNPYILFGTNVNTKNEVKDVVYSTDIRNVDNASEPYSPINLKFSHFFSSIKIEVKNVSGEAQNKTNFEFEGFYSLSNEFAKVYFNGGSNLSFVSDKGKYSSSDVRLENGQSWFPLGVNPIMVWPQSFSTGHNPFFEFKSNDNDKFLLFTDIGVGQWQSGKLHHITLNLAPDPVRLYPEVEITHVMNDDGTTPKYSDVSISLNPTDNKFDRLHNLRITVLDENGTPTGLEYSSATVNSNDIVISGQDKSLTLTPGQSFVVKFEYNDTYNDYSDQVTVKSPETLQKFIYSDGTQGNNANRNDIVGVIIFRGNPKTVFNDPDIPNQYCNGLAISIKGVSTAWNTSSVTGQPDQAKVTMSAGSITNSTYGGYTVKQIWQDNGFNNLKIYDDNLYGALPSNTSGWYLATDKEWSYIYSKLDEINNNLKDVTGAEQISTDTSDSYGNSNKKTFWLPLWYKVSSSTYYAATAYFNGTVMYSYTYNYSYTRIARPIFAF